MAGERVLFLNGELIEENRARISPFDRGFLWGDGVYEVTPCFDGKLYRLDDHLDRLYRSLLYVRIDPGMSPEQMKEATLDTLDSNAGRLEEGGMYRVGHWVTRGEDDPSMGALAAGSATVMIFFRPVQVEKIAPEKNSPGGANWPFSQYPGTQSPTASPGEAALSSHSGRSSILIIKV